MIRYLVFAIALALAGCISVDKKTDADGATCQIINLPAVHWSSCTAPAAPQSGVKS
ncbi:MAG TPA: hypothetical protein VGL83_08130 [Stellaceae bacterium]|jgi:hypothetical protein